MLDLPCPQMVFFDTILTEYNWVYLKKAFLWQLSHGIISVLFCIFYLNYNHAWPVIKERKWEVIISVPPIGYKPILVILSKSWLIAMRPWVVTIMEDIFFHKWDILLSISYKYVEFSINLVTVVLLYLFLLSGYLIVIR